jgi:hypothetical protein
MPAEARGIPAEARKEYLRKPGSNTRGSQEGLPEEARKEYLRNPGRNN